MARFTAFLLTLTAADVFGQKLPDTYFRLLEAGVGKIEARLAEFPEPSLAAIESTPGWRHFPYAILAPAVLYSKAHPANRRYRNAGDLQLAIRIGDLLAAESEKGTFEPRLDSDWDTYMWLEALRLLGPAAGDERAARWRREIEKNIAPYEEPARERLDFPWYNSPYIGTSPNHYALWAANLYLGGRMFGKPAWVELGRRILRRFALEEQTADGYWGEHSRSGPTTGYNHLTLSALGVYYEHSQDREVLPALRRATDFHRHYTFLDGTAVDVINDRNRYWGPSAWGHFAFTPFPEGRGFAAFLAGRFKPESLGVDQIGRLAQNAIYYHEGPAAPAPQQQAAYSHRMTIPAGIRKTGPWQVAMSGIVDTKAINSRFYLDRQGAVSIFHERLGLIVTGANSKRQPEVASFSERLPGETVTIPLSSRLKMESGEDRLSVAFNTFFADLYFPVPSPEKVEMRVVITGRGRPADDPRFNLQLCLRAGKDLETGGGRRENLGKDGLRLDGRSLGGVIRHNGWTLEFDQEASLTWPVYPHNPYTDSPETDVAKAVGVLSVPLRLTPKPGRYVRPGDQSMRFVLSTGKAGWQ